MNKCLLVAFFSTSLFCSAQQSEPSFKSITTNHGLSHSWVRSIFQDSTGYLWFSTADGLNRYDGFECKTYSYSELDTNSIGNNRIRFMEFHEKGKMWVGTDMGLYIYDEVHDHFEKSDLLQGLTVRRIEDSGGETWFGTNEGLFHYDKASGTLTAYQHDQNDPSSLSNNEVYDLLLDSNNNLWIGTYEGLNLLVKDTGSFIRYLPSNDKRSISSSWVSGIAEDPWGQIWTGSPGGVDVFVNAKERPEKGVFRQVTDLYTLELTVTSHGQLWIGGGTGNGLGILDLETFDLNQKPEINWYKQRPFDEQSLTDNSIIYVFEDRLGDLWLGTFGGGISYHSPRNKNFQVVQKYIDPMYSISSNQVNCFLENEEHLWIGTEFGLDRVDKSSGNWTHFYQESDNSRSLGANAIYALFEDSKKHIWVGAWNGGLNRFNPADQSFTTFLPGSNFSISNPHIFSIEEQEGSLWVGTIGGGLNKLDLSSNKFVSYQHDPNNKLTLANNSINDLVVTRSGQLYISSMVKIERFDPANQTFEKIDLYDQNRVKPFFMCLTDDSSGNIWIGSDLGVAQYNPVNQEVKYLSESDGLISNSVMAIIEDHNKSIWVSTTGGLSKISLQDEVNIWNYDKTDGLPTNEFIKRSTFKNSDGKLYFGSSNGFVSFFPSEIKDYEIPPVVVIDGIEIKKNTRRIPGFELYNAHYGNSPIVLNHDQSDFEISFKGINYLSPEGTRYRYRLKGYEDLWHDSETTKTANYTNIPPGLFEFQVIAANQDNYWTTEPSSLLLTIQPAWYQRLAFRVFLYSSIIGLIIGAFFIRSSIYRRNQNRLEEEVAKRTAEVRELNRELKNSNQGLSEINEEVTQQRNELATALKDLEITMNKLVESEKLASLGIFTAGIAHEINNPMNYIAGATSAAHDVINQLKENKPVDPQELEKLKKMHRYIEEGIERVTKIIGGLKNYARMDDDEFVKYNVINSIEDALIVLENRLKKNFEIIKEFDEEVIIECLPGRISQVMVNLITNATDAIEGKGVITIAVVENDENITISISDNGPGIPLEDRNRLFDPFFTTKEAGQGTGLGLYITHGFVAKHGGSITFESDLGKGTKFIIKLPIEQSTA